MGRRFCRGQSGGCGRGGYRGRKRHRARHRRGARVGGAKVVVNYSRSKEPAEEVVARLSDNGNDQVVAIGADVSMADEAFRLIEETLERFGRIDILVNNAGITIDRTMKKLTVEEWDTVVQVDLNSCYYTVKAALPHFIEQESGYIINMSSFVGEAGNFGQTNYVRGGQGGADRVYEVRRPGAGPLQRKGERYLSGLYRDRHVLLRPRQREGEDPGEDTAR